MRLDRGDTVTLVGFNDPKDDLTWAGVYRIISRDGVWCGLVGVDDRGKSLQSLAAGGIVWVRRRDLTEDTRHEQETLT